MAPPIRFLTLACSGAILLAGASTRAAAATRVVPDQYATVQSALVAASSGDTVVIRAGTYVESLSLAGKNLVILGAEEPGVTTLTTQGAGRILEIGAGVTHATELRRLRFENGSSNDGGAIRIANGAAPRLRGCVFAGNRADEPSGATGGAIEVEYSEADLEDCRFEQNRATSSDLWTCKGGAIAVLGPATLSARRCSFVRNVATGLEGGPGGALYLEFATASVESCLFDQNAGGEGEVREGVVRDGGAVSAFGASFTIRGCLFRGNVTGFGAAALWCWSDETFEIAGNTFVDHRFGSVLQAIGAGLVENNTIAFNRMELSQFYALDVAYVRVERNVIASNDGRGVNCDEPASFACNDVWANSGGNLWGCESAGNLSADPLFCDPSIRDLRVRPESPCAPAGACGGIGAQPVGCAASGVESHVAAEIAIRAVSPNPSRDRVRFELELPRSGRFHSEIVDALGRTIVTLATGTSPAGSRTIEWRPGRDVRPGVYWLVVEIDGVRATRRFARVR